MTGSVFVDTKQAFVKFGSSIVLDRRRYPRRARSQSKSSASCACIGWSSLVGSRALGSVQWSRQVTKVADTTRSDDRRAWPIKPSELVVLDPRRQRQDHSLSTFAGVAASRKTTSNASHTVATIDHRPSSPLASRVGSRTVIDLGTERALEVLPRNGGGRTAKRDKIKFGLAERALESTFLV